MTCHEQIHILTQSSQDTVHFLGTKCFLMSNLDLSRRNFQQDYMAEFSCCCFVTNCGRKALELHPCNTGPLGWRSEIIVKFHTTIYILFYIEIRLSLITYFRARNFIDVVIPIPYQKFGVAVVCGISTWCWVCGCNVVFDEWNPNNFIWLALKMVTTRRVRRQWVLWIFQATRGTVVAWNIKIAIVVFFNECWGFFVHEKHLKSNSFLFRKFIINFKFYSFILSALSTGSCPYIRFCISSMTGSYIHRTFYVSQI